MCEGKGRKKSGKRSELTNRSANGKWKREVLWKCSKGKCECEGEVKMESGNGKCYETIQGLVKEKCKWIMETGSAMELLKW